LKTIIKKPSALIPLTMALIALGIVLGHFALYGNLHETDEGAAAHIFQILIAAQVPFILFFAIKWLPRSPKESIKILILQSIIITAAFTAVFFLT